MGTSRGTAAGTLMVVLLGGVATGVVARPGSEVVSGTTTYVEELVEPTVTMVGDVEQIRGASATYAFEMSDPRVSGTLTTLDLGLDAYGGTQRVFAGAAELANDAGTWSGPWSGMYEPTIGWQAVTSLDGHGAYDGLTFHLHMASPESDDGIGEVEGFIVEDVPTPTG